MAEWRSASGKTAAEKWRAMPIVSKRRMLNKSGFGHKYTSYLYSELTPRLKAEVRSFRARQKKKSR